MDTLLDIEKGLNPLFCPFLSKVYVYYFDRKQLLIFVFVKTLNLIHSL